MNALEIADQLPLALSTYEKQNKVLDEFTAFLGGHCSRARYEREQHEAMESFGGRNHASYAVGFADALEEIFRFLREHKVEV